MQARPSQQSLVPTSFETGRPPRRQLRAMKPHKTGFRGRGCDFVTGHESAAPRPKAERTSCATPWPAVRVVRVASQTGGRGYGWAPSAFWRGALGVRGPAAPLDARTSSLKVRTQTHAVTPPSPGWAAAASGPRASAVAAAGMASRRHSCAA
jgi:hypothetical protein